MVILQSRKHLPFDASYSYFSAIRQLMSASHSALTAISAAGKVEEILQTDTSRPYNPELPADPEHLTEFAWSMCLMAMRAAAERYRMCH